MKNITLSLLAVFVTTCYTFSQNDYNCVKTCMIEKTIHEGAILGVKFGCQCGTKNKAGVLIEEIVNDTAAAKSILQVNDVILSVNDKRTKRRARIIDILNRMKPFQNVKLEFLRDGVIKNVDVILGARITRIIQEEVCCDLAENL